MSKITVIDRYYAEEVGGLDRFVKRQTNHRTLLKMLEAEQDIAFTQCAQDAHCFDCANHAKGDEVTITRAQLRQLGEEIIRLSETFADQDEAERNSPEEKARKKLRRLQ